MKFFRFALVFIAAYVLINTFLIGISSKEPQKEKYDAIIVLGVSSKIKNLAEPFLKLRLDRAIDLYNSGYSKVIILSGGATHEPKSEAEKMKEYLLEKGIPENQIILEDRSLSTEENIVYSNEMIDKFKFKNALIITSNNHISRVKHLIKKYGYSNYEVINSNNNLLSVLVYLPARILDQTKFNRPFTFR